MFSAEPELIIVDAKIVTMAADGGISSALAIKNGKIVAVGEDHQVRKLAGPATKEMAMAGRTIIPGIIDSHCHPDGAASRVINWHDLSPSRIKNRAALLAHIEKAAEGLAADSWIFGYRLNEGKSGGYPSLQELDDASHGRPLFILRTDGHLGLANSAAFNALGIDRHTPDPPFGAYDHDPDSGALTGLVREAAAQIFVEHAQSVDTPESQAEGLSIVFDDYLKFGITSVYNSLTCSKAINAYQIMKSDGRLKLRVGIIASGREEGLVEALIAAGVRSGFGDDWVKVVAVEWCPDCSTSGRTAAYYEPYIGEKALGEPENNTGMLLYEPDDLAARATAAHKAGLLVCIEGVGDRGIDFALDAIEAALKKHPVPDHRMRVEHCCYVTPKVMARIKKLGVVDSSATGFMYDLGDAYVANRGEAAMQYMWPHRSLIDAGIPAPGHSDSYVCTPNPFVALWSLVNRQSDGGGSLDTPGAGSQAISIEEALHAYTTLGAFSGREENLKGSLEVGKFADLAVLDRDILSIPSQDIRNVEVELTMVGGEIMYERGKHRN